MRQSSELDTGYRIIPGIVSGAECDRLLSVLMQPRISKSREGLRHRLSIPLVGRLARSGQLLTIASEELGIGAVPFRATLFAKQRESNWSVMWHQDTALPLKSRFDS